MLVEAVEAVFEAWCQSLVSVRELDSEHRSTED